MLAFITLLLGGGIFYSFYTQALDRRLAVPVSIAVFIVFGLSLFPTAKRLFNDSIILSFDFISITITDRHQSVTIDWADVTDWKIEKDNNNYLLIIKTPNLKKKVDLQWLEKTPPEIEALIQQVTSRSYQ
ncbi:hypothetical protein [Terrimonas ferruginea]|uniref:hypothetical protein n=1 Tax=Terrimonas ferruginea TaxID=249 RepID=UPI000427EF13|nr:hypothetical protein [Terrimonas ferruginea]